jgi:hypothetical protein
MTTFVLYLSLSAFCCNTVTCLQDKQLQQQTLGCQSPLQAQKLAEGCDASGWRSRSVCQELLIGHMFAGWQQSGSIEHVLQLTNGKRPCAAGGEVL